MGAVPSPQNLHLEVSEKEENRDKDYCKLCDVGFTCETQAVQHYEGKRHQKNVKTASTAAELEECDDPNIKIEGNSFTCTLCSVQLTARDQLDTHLKGAKHQMKARGDTVKRGPDGDAVPRGRGAHRGRGRGDRGRGGMRDRGMGMDRDRGDEPERGFPMMRGGPHGRGRGDFRGRGDRNGGPDFHGGPDFRDGPFPNRPPFGPMFPQNSGPRPLLNCGPMFRGPGPRTSKRTRAGIPPYAQRNGYGYGTTAKAWSGQILKVPFGRRMNCYTFSIEALFRLTVNMFL
ncbi:hypothetical protein ScPMuIL_007891 [Solemya velum]